MMMEIWGCIDRVECGVKVNTEVLGALGQMPSGISLLEISGCDGSNLLSRTDDKSLSLPTVELQPDCSHPVFNFGKAGGEGLNEPIEVLRIGAVIELSDIRN